MRTVSRLRLLYLLDLRSSPTVLPSLISTAVETMASPSKANSPLRVVSVSYPFQVSLNGRGRTYLLLVEMAGVEPASSSPSL